MVFTWGRIRKRFEPSFALGLALHSSEVENRVEISLEEFSSYTAGHTIAVSKDLANGWYQVAVQGNGLSFAKLYLERLKRLSKRVEILK